MTTLTDFLLARIAEDEEVARRAGDSGPVTHGRRSELTQVWDRDYGEIEGAVEYDSLRVLAECEAKRRIVEFHRPSTDHGDAYAPYCVGCWEEGGMDGAPNHPCRTVRWIALPYADHPDYREEWKP